MPFGLTNATATYARALTFVRRRLLWKKCVAYCDDTVTFDDHMDSLHAVLKRYAIHNVNVKISKCHFACARTEFVVHQVEVGAGVKFCEKKVKAILEMKRPSNVQELTSFIGMCSYYKRFSKDFAHIAMPLRRIENVFKSKLQSTPVLWKDTQEKAFNVQKVALATAPVLAFPDFSKPMIVLSDCSDTAQGAVLCQNIEGIERPIMYLSQALNEHELGYGIRNKEGCAATWAMRRMHPWILSNQLVLIADHSSLVALTRGKELKNMRQQRYATDLSEFALTIKYRAGALLHTADAPSRCGYTKKHADSMVEQLRHRPLEQCSVERLKPMFEEVRDGSWLKARVAATETGLESRTMKQLCDKLELHKVMATYVKESDEEESRTVEMYGMVSLVSTRSSKMMMQMSAGKQKEEDTQLEESM